MPLDLTPLQSKSRLLVEAELKVTAGGGGRFQPTGFPDLGPALYRGADGADWLLVESPQSMANRLERVCWTDGDGETDRVGDYNEACKGIPYVLATDTNKQRLTASTLEAHRLSSPYIWDTKPFEHPDKQGAQVSLPEFLKDIFTLAENRIVPWKKVAEGLLRVDPGCLLHGVWFNESSFAGGKVRLARALSGYIEARDPSAANFGFQKRDGVSDRTDKEAGQSAAEGYGSVIGPKQHFTSAEIKAYFQIDIERLRSYGLSQDQVHALAVWAIYKIRRVLVSSRDGIADLRTECKFEATKVTAELVDSDTGERSSYGLPVIDPELIDAFKLLKSSNRITVIWAPNVEGKAELPENMPDAAINRSGLEAKTKLEIPKPKKGKRQDANKSKRIFVVFGEWSSADKEALRELNLEEPAKAIVERALKDYEAKWEAKAQSRKPAENDNSSPEDGGTTE